MVVIIDSPQSTVKIRLIPRSVDRFTISLSLLSFLYPAATILQPPILVNRYFSPGELFDQFSVSALTQTLNPTLNRQENPRLFPTGTG
jgi:hypothetical protein